MIQVPKPDEKPTLPILADDDETENELAGESSPLSHEENLLIDPEYGHPPVEPV